MAASNLLGSVQRKSFLMDFPIVQVDSILCLPDGQVKVFWENVLVNSSYRSTVREVLFWLVHSTA